MPLEFDVNRTTQRAIIKKNNNPAVDPNRPPPWNFLAGKEYTFIVEVEAKGSSEGNITFGVIGTEYGSVISAKKMNRLGSGTIRHQVTFPEKVAGNKIYYQILPVYNKSQAIHNFELNKNIKSKLPYIGKVNSQYASCRRLNDLKQPIEFPQYFYSILFLFAFILILSPLLSNQDFGIFKVPTFSKKGNFFASIIGFIILISSFSLYQINDSRRSQINEAKHSCERQRSSN